MPNKKAPSQRQLAIIGSSEKNFFHKYYTAKNNFLKVKKFFHEYYTAKNGF